MPESQKAKIETLARDHGLMNAVKPQRENSMACVSFPTCPLAMAEAERFLPSFTDKVEAILEKHGIPDEHIVMRVTGCPNGCGRAMLAEIGLVGKRPVVITCILVATASGVVSHGCIKKISPSRIFWPRWMN